MSDYKEEIRKRARARRSKATLVEVNGFGRVRIGRMSIPDMLEAEKYDDEPQKKYALMIAGSIRNEDGSKTFELDEALDLLDEADAEDLLHLLQAIDDQQPKAAPKN